MREGTHSTQWGRGMCEMSTKLGCFTSKEWFYCVLPVWTAFKLWQFFQSCSKCKQACSPTHFSFQSNYYYAKWGELTRSILLLGERKGEKER